MAKYVTLNGIEFKVITPKTDNYDYYNKLFDLRDYKTLSDCYARPSEAKRNIYAWWKYWFASLFGIDGLSFKQFCGIRSYNGFMFTLVGIICYYGEDYIVDITPKHNHLIKVVTNKDLTKAQ